jgi:hypothetical protein
VHIVADHTPIAPRRPAASKRNPFVLVPIVLLLHELLEQNDEVPLRLSDLSDTELGELYGLSEFATRTVDVEQTLDDAQFRWTIVHEFLHHLYGPAGCRQAGVDEARFEASTAVMMLDAAGSSTGSSACWRVPDERPAAAIGYAAPGLV